MKEEDIALEKEIFYPEKENIQNGRIEVLTSYYNNDQMYYEDIEELAFLYPYAITSFPINEQCMYDELQNWIQYKYTRM